MSVKLGFGELWRLVLGLVWLVVLLQFFFFGVVCFFSSWDVRVGDKYRVGSKGSGRRIAGACSTETEDGEDFGDGEKAGGDRLRGWGGSNTFYSWKGVFFGFQRFNSFSLLMMLLLFSSVWVAALKLSLSEEGRAGGVYGGYWGRGEAGKRAGC